MAEGTNNIDCLSCNNSSYNEQNLEVSNSGNAVHSGSEERNVAVMVLTHWVRRLTSLKLVEPTATLHPAPTSAHDGLDHLQLAWCSFVCAHIQMSMFSNLHCVVVVGGGDFM